MVIKFIFSNLFPVEMIALGVFLIIMSKRISDKFRRRSTTEITVKIAKFKPLLIPELVIPQYTATIDGQPILLTNKTPRIKSLLKQKEGDEVKIHLDRASLNDFYIHGKKPIFKIIGIVSGGLFIAGGIIWLIFVIISAINYAGAA